MIEVNWKKRMADCLRRAADRLDSAPSPVKADRVEPATPLEYIPSLDLATEILRRNDAGIVYWARVNDLSQPSEGTGEIVFKMNKENLHHSLKWIILNLVQSINADQEGGQHDC